VREFETLLGLLLAAVALAGIARKIGVPYPAFLALGGALLAFVPGVPPLSIEPQLALALFVAPVLLDAAYDASPRDLRDNWPPLLNLVVVNVGLTTVGVAWVARELVPEIPWAAAIALGAIVSPPDATAATAVLRHVKLPHRIVTILEGESLLNDASALLIYRLAVAALVADGFSLATVAPALVIVVGGSIAVGIAAAWLLLRVSVRVHDIPTSIIIQFISTFGIWILAEGIGLSGILTMVCFAVSVARRAPELMPARMRIPSYAVWDTVVFLVNVLAFIFIGLQLRPILSGLEPALRTRYLYVAAVVLLTVILVRFAWVMTYVTFVRWKIRRFGFHPRRPRPQPSFAGALVVSWSGMRGIVSLAAALALPFEVNGADFPFRDLIVLTAFSVVLGTLVIQGLTLGPLLGMLDIFDDRPVEREVAAARDRALSAALATFDGDSSEAARAARHDFTSHLRRSADDNVDSEPASEHDELRRRAVAAARQAVLRMRATDEIGDEAFHQLEEELDWIEMGTT
jgi:CPA1 family monovalent cation:H+ antiporter